MAGRYTVTVHAKSSFPLISILNKDGCTKLSSLCYSTYFILYSYYVVTMLCRVYATLRTLSLNAKYPIWVNWIWFHMLSHSQVTCIELLIIICVQPRVSAHTCFGLVALVSRALSTSTLVKFKQNFEHTVIRAGPPPPPPPPTFS